MDLYCCENEFVSSSLPSCSLLFSSPSGRQWVWMKTYTLVQVNGVFPSNDIGEGAAAGLGFRCFRHLYLFLRISLLPPLPSFGNVRFFDLLIPFFSFFSGGLVVVVEKLVLVLTCL